RCCGCSQRNTAPSRSDDSSAENRLNTRPMRVRDVGKRLANRSAMPHTDSLARRPTDLSPARTPRFVDARPYQWPWNGDLRPANTVFLVIDMQTDFCGKGGYVDTMGYDLSLTRAPIAPIQSVLAATRAAGFHVMH